MKKSVVMAFLISFAAYETYAQYDQDYAREFKPFKVGIGIGYAQPGSGKGAGGGFLGYLEPAYRATDQVLVGLRLEGAFVVRGIKGVNNRDISGDASSVASYTLNSQYYFNNNHVRPFVGAGVGLFSLAAAKFNTATNNNPGVDDIGAETRFGFYPRVGIDVGHFNLTLDYNVVPPTDVPDGGEVKNNYLGIRAGVSIGGGPTK
ncbi:MAG: OmpW family outer membrane protein [Chryseosolibacter sp.]